MSSGSRFRTLLVYSLLLLLLLPFFRVLSQILPEEVISGGAPEAAVALLHVGGLLLVGVLACYVSYHFGVRLPVRVRSVRPLPVLVSMAIGVLGGFYFVGELGGVEPGVLLVLMVLLSAVVEEYVFRGLFLTVWARRLGFWRALLLQAALFSVMHPMNSLPYILGYFVYGLLLGGMVWYYPRSGVLYAIIAHLVSNLTEIVLVAAGVSSLL